MLRIPIVLFAGALASARAERPSAPLTLVDARPITTAADWGELAWAPDASQVSAFGEGGLWRIDLGGGEPSPVPMAAGQRVFRHRFPGAPEPADSQPSTWASRDDIWVRSAGVERRVTQGEDRFYDPVLSPDGRMVVFTGLITGLHVMDLDGGALVHLGPGRWPGWHPRGGWLVFERDTDDGHQLTSAALVQWRPGSSEALPLIAESASLDRFPTFSADGQMLAWVRDGAVWVARVQEVTP